MNAITLLTAAERAVLKAKTVQELKTLRDKAEAVRTYARQAGLGLEIENHAAEVRLRAERRAGELLAAMEKAKGAREPGTNRGSTRSPEVTASPKLQDLGVTKAQSSRWQAEASVPEKEFKDWVEKSKDAKERITSGRLVKEFVKKRKIEEIKKRAAAEEPKDPGLIKNLSSASGQFRTIYADPPWRYDDAGCDGAAEGQYPTLSIKQLQDLGAGKLAHADGCHLWMWTTWPMIRDVAPNPILAAWGFRWVGEIVWLKPGMGVGRWLRPSTEVLILAVKGSLPLLKQDQRGHLEAPRGRHSQKPDAFYDLIERLSPGPRIELFARRAREGWSRWGLEA